MSKEARLLVAERDAGTLSILTSALTRAGYEVVGARNGSAVLNRPEGFEPQVILLSSRLAGEDGFKTAQHLKESLHSWTIPILLLIPEEQRKEGESMEAFGADAWIEIPCPTHRLIEKVEALRAEKQMREKIHTRMRSRIEEGLDENLDQTVQMAIQNKVQGLVEQLSAGLVDLVEEEARTQMNQRMAALAEEQGREMIANRVRELATPLVNEVAEDLVSRQVSAMSEEKADALIGRFEKEDMPGIARRVVQQTAEEYLPMIVDQAAESATKRIVEDLKLQLAPLIEKLVGQHLPKVAQQKLPPLIETQAESYFTSTVPRRVQSAMEEEMEQKIRPALKKQMNKVLGIAFLVLILSGAIGVALKFFIK